MQPRLGGAPWSFIIVLTLGAAVSPQMARAKEPPRQVSVASDHVVTAVDQYLTSNLRIDPEHLHRFNLTLKMRRTLERALGGHEKAFKADGGITPEARAILEKGFSPLSKKVLSELFKAFGLEEFNNAMLIGQAGVGKSFTLRQLTALLSFGVIPDFLAPELGMHPERKSHFLDGLRAALLEKTELILINNDLLSRDNTKNGQAFAKADMRMKSLIMELFDAARKEYQDSGIHTVFILEEVATLPPLVQQTLKALLDETGYKDPENTFAKAAEVGYMALGITTPTEYKEMINGDSAVERRYAKVIHPEPNEVEALNILEVTKAPWEKRYHLTMSRDVAEYLVSMRKFFNNPPLAMPHSIIRAGNSLFNWVADPRHAHHGDEITREEAWEWIVHNAQLPAEAWLGGADRSHPPLWNLAQEAQAQGVVGNARLLKDVSRKIKTAVDTGFADFPVFIFMGPSGSGKDTIAKAINRVVYGHDGIMFSLAGPNRLGSILEGTEHEPPELLTKLNEGPANSLIILNEGKDLASHDFDKLKTFVERGELRPKGKDSRTRTMGLNALVIMGEWSSERFQDKTDEEAAQIASRLTEEDLIADLMRGHRDGKMGAMPYALIQRALRTGGIYLVPPMPKSRYPELIALNLRRIEKKLSTKGRERAEVSIDQSVADLIYNTAVAENRSTRALEGLTSDLTESAVTEARDRDFPRSAERIHIRAENGSRLIAVESLDPDGKVLATVKIPVGELRRDRCEEMLSNS